MKKLFRKIKKKILVALFGRCYVYGHKWKMKKGWQNNPKYDIDNPPNPKNVFEGMFKAWIYYECKVCRAHGEKVRNFPQKKTIA